jgi:transcriptional regulator with GAF, ATPase, and Fis domain
MIVTGIFLVACYCAAVFSYVLTIPDIGLRCAFDQEVSRVFPEFIYGDGREAHDLVGANITRIGSHEVENWPHVLRLLIQLRSDEAVPIDDATQLDASRAPHVMLNGTELVHVELQRPGQSEPIGVWCKAGRAPLATLLPSILWFFLKGSLFLVAVLVCWKQPLDRSRSMFFWLSLCTVGAYIGGFHWWRIATQPVLLLVFVVSSVLLSAVSLHFYLVFPRPKTFLVRHPRLTLISLYSLPVVFLVLLVAGCMRVRWLYSGGSGNLVIENILGKQIDRLYRALGLGDDLKDTLAMMVVQIRVYLAVAATLYATSLGCLLHSFRTATDATERNQVKWILLGILISVGPIGYSLYLAFGQPSDFGGGAATWPMFVASAVVTVSFIISITRYRLMELDQIVSSSMVYFLMSGVAGLVYYGVVFLGALLFSLSRPSWGQAMAVASTALVFMLGLDWLRSRVKKALDRRFHREQYQLERTLRRMRQAIDQLVEPPTLARRLLQAVVELLNVPRGSIYIREGAEPLYRLLDSVGEPPPLQELSSGCPLIEEVGVRGTAVLRRRSTNAEPLRRQLEFLGGVVAQGLVHEGQLLAILVLGPREPGPYSIEDLNVLGAFAHITALALVGAQGHRRIDNLNRDIQEKVAKIAEQQRSILALQSKLRGDGVAAMSGSVDGAASLQLTAGSAAAPAAAAPFAGRDGSAEELVGSSGAMRQLLELVRKVAGSESAVLLRGESGTGKELLAHFLHLHGPRASKPFVTVHCAALSPTLLESELFGHVKGAFTGAHRDKIGRFELANGGTLFLDEIGDISLDVQTKLLRVLQEMTFERVGSSNPVEVDVRIIAATHQNLEELMSSGRFREDLYYRLNVISIGVPALRERREDITELVQHFLSLNARRSGKPTVPVDDDALLALRNYAWPGNIRQLENAIERAVVIAEGRTVTIVDLPPEVVNGASSLYGEVTAKPDGHLNDVGTGIDRERHERERLVRALASANGNKAEAARALALPRSTFLSRLKKYGLA